MIETAMKYAGNHFKELCKTCTKVIAQCRCMSKDKTLIIVRDCPECKEKNAESLQQAPQGLPEGRGIRRETE